MAAPKLKTNSIIKALKPSMDAGELLLSDFDKQKLLREVRAIPEAYQALAIEGMIQFLDGKVLSGTQCLERSLELCPTDGVTWKNYSAVLYQKAQYCQQEEILHRALGYPITSMFTQALAFGAFWGDMEMMKKSADLMDKYNLPYREDDGGARDTMLNFLDIDESLRLDIMNAARVVRDLAEREGLVCRKSHIENDGYGEMAFSCEIETDDADYLMNLNSQIIDEMVANGLETGRCVAYFEVFED